MSLSKFSSNELIKILICEFLEITDIDAILSLIKLFSSTDASILIFLSLSKPYGQKKDIISFENAYRDAYDIVKKKENLSQNDFNLALNEEFNNLVPYNKTSGYNYSIDKDYMDAVNHIIYIINLMFNRFKKNSEQKLFIRFQSDKGEHYINECNPFGYGYTGEHKFFEKFFDEHKDYDIKKDIEIDSNPDLNNYDKIILHISGSCPSILSDEEFTHKLFSSGKIKMISIMGGVDSSKETTTSKLPYICREMFATMNQRYSSASFTKLMELISKLDDEPIKVVISNNLVNEVANYGNLSTQDEFVDRIYNNILKINFDKNDKTDVLLDFMIRNYYVEDKKFFWKLFDVVSASMICEYINNDSCDFKDNSLMYTEEKEGNTIVDIDGVAKLEERLNKIKRNINDPDSITTRVYHPERNLTCLKYFEYV